MFKTGICSLKDLIAAPQAVTLFRRALKNVSISLYEEACAAENADELAQRVLLLFSDERGAYKRTYAKRFETFEKDIFKKLPQYLDVSKPLKVHDVAVSDGRTAADFFEKLSASYSKLEVTASDYDPTVKIIEKGRLKVALTSSGNLLEVTFAPFVFNMVKPDLYLLYPLNYFIKKVVVHLWVKPLLQSYKKGKTQAKDVFLFAPQALKLAKQNKQFTLSQHNILQPLPGKHQLIRAMNILNKTYFTNDEFRQIMKNLHTALSDGGILITGSNQDADTTVDGTIYQKTADGFKVIWTSGNGSPVKAYIDGYTAAASSS